MDRGRTILAQTHIPRRAVLRRALSFGLAASAVGSWLAACGGSAPPPASAPSAAPTVAPTAAATATSAPTATPAATSTPVPPEALRLSYGPDPSQFGDLRLPAGPGPHPVALVIHGGGWATSNNVDFTAACCVALAAQGIASWNIEYRRLGNPGGGWPGSFLDVAAAADHLRMLAHDRPLDLARVAFVGYSSGGHMALWLGGRRRVPTASPLAQPDPLPARVVISLAGITDLKRAWDLRLVNGAVSDLLGGLPEEQPERYAAASPIALLPLGTRQVLVHGDLDQTVPYQMAVDYQAAARASGDDVTLLTQTRTGHSGLVYPTSEPWQQAQAAIVAALAP